jgi:RNA polymerase sigma-70 factor (ECF subfamily)
MTANEFNKAVDDYSDSIYRFILKNIKDKDKASDIVQDTYEKLWRRMEEVSYQKIKSYLFTAAYHTMIDVIRKDKKSDDFSSFDFNGYAHSSQYSDLQEVLHIALERLPNIQRSVILLRDYEGYSYQEIAEITGLNESQVKVYIYRGRIFLKNYIGNIEAVI